MRRSPIRESDIQVGALVRVLVQGPFFGQEVAVLLVERDRGGRLWYRLAVTWDGKARPSWFEAHEIEKVEEA